MKFKPNKVEIMGLAVAIAVVLISGIFFLLEYIESNLFYFLFGISFLIAGFPFFVSLIIESNVTQEKDEMFLEFSRDLVENVKAGTPISRSIINLKTKDYGSLSPYIQKLANQISLGIPVQTSFETFARDVESRTVRRAVSIISESEKAGGDIGNVLESVAKSVSQVDKLKKERRAAMFNLIVQGYIIFFIFIVIMLVMEFKVLPIASGLSSGVGSDFGELPVGGLIGNPVSPEELAQPFLWLLITQGLFVGLVIGKLSEGRIRDGLKHSFILIVLALLIDGGAKLFLG